MGFEQADKRVSHGLDSLKKSKLHNAEFTQSAFIMSNAASLSCHMELAKQHLKKYIEAVLSRTNLQ